MLPSLSQRIKSLLSAAATAAIAILYFILQRERRKNRRLEHELVVENDKDESAAAAAEVSKAEKDVADAKKARIEADNAFDDSLSRIPGRRKR